MSQEDYTKKMEDLIIRLHEEGILSEGQVARATGLDRVEIRTRCHVMTEQRMKDDFYGASVELTHRIGDF